MRVRIAIPSIPSRGVLLQRALDSVARQAVPDGVDVDACVYLDETRQGAWVARNEALRLALSDDPCWVGFLDDDDELDAHHVGALIEAAESECAQIVWGWYRVQGGGDPFPENKGKQLDHRDPHIVPIAYLARATFLRKALAEMGGFQPNGDAPLSHGWWAQDWPILKHMIEAGAKPLAVDQVTWTWHHHGRNTSGMPNRF